MTHGLKQLLLGLFLLTSICSACQSREEGLDKNSLTRSGKILIVYLSRKNNTKKIAEIIHENMGGMRVGLELKSHIPRTVKSFVNQYDLSGKTVVPFNTHAGYGIGSGFRTVKELCPKSKVLEGFSTKGGVERDGIYFVIEVEKEKQARDEIKRWLRKIKLIR